ncbi:hypothetical protein J1N35_033276 [Gossypium stocksii]|uniref:Reverse transcriptase n=1 Tax=Gossypium stocksii TaxID=47602 RepID=A0A9D3UQ39_9ROSI|nr:hypothetical protein J1N35_033276 [Gossypium stocksii]
MGFDRNWIESLMNCLTTVSYSIVVNRYIRESFHPTRGLRQGAPLSLFLFLICGEGLSCLMRIVSKEGLLKGAKISRSGPQISHLLFTDDCIIFGQATRRGATLLKEILREDNKNTEEEDRQEVVNILGLRSSDNPERGLGFRNMSQFNITLLDKQGWRLINYPNSLVARVLKTKYYPQIDFIDALLGSLPSITWKSVWATKGLLKTSMCWRVGRGMGSRFGRTVGFQERNLMSGTIGTAVKDPNIVGSTFQDAIAQQIIQILLAGSPHNDLQVWKGESSGEFTVKSTYKLLQEASLGPSDYRITWNYILTFANLKCKRIINSALCPRWGNGEEDSIHVFQQCPVTIEIWQRTAITNNVDLFAAGCGSSGAPKINSYMKGR